MKFSKKFLVMLGLVALLTASLVTSAFASDTRLMGFARVDKVKMLDDQPASFSLLGSYTCDRVQVSSSVEGKTISIYARDVKVKHSGTKCDSSKSFKRSVNLGTLVPGKYTVLINPDGSGKAQKKFSFIAPMLPTPAPTSPAQP